MSPSYEESFASTVWYFLPGIVKFVAGIGVLATAFVGINLGLSTNSVPYIPEPNLTRSYNYTLGPKEARVELVYFVDLQCPACQANNAPFQEIKNRYKDKVHFVYKNYPLTEMHANAEQAAFAAQAAGRQGKYFEYIDKIFANQDLGLTNTNLEKFAKDLSLDLTKWNRDRNSDEVRREVRWDQQDLNNASLPVSSRSGRPKAAGEKSGTPTIVIKKDGQIIDWWTGGSTVEELSKKLDDWLAS
jgi:hypothetical protein